MSWIIILLVMIFLGVDPVAAFFLSWIAAAFLDEAKTSCCHHDDNK